MFLINLFMIIENNIYFMMGLQKNSHQPIWKKQFAFVVKKNLLHLFIAARSCLSILFVICIYLFI